MAFFAKVRDEVLSAILPRAEAGACVTQPYICKCVPYPLCSNTCKTALYYVYRYACNGVCTNRGVYCGC
jgi:hypothetical protein